MAFLNVKNRAESTLAANITNIATSLNVVAGEGARFPASNFHFTIGDEIIHCATRTTDTFSSLTRAREGTTAISHLAGAKVELRITAKHIDDLKAAAPASIMTTKGDVIVRDASAPVRLPVGPNDQVLTADSAAAGGIKWAAAVAAGATTALNNLVSVAINTSLISNANLTNDLGSPTIFWRDIYLDSIYLANTANRIFASGPGNVNVNIDTHRSTFDTSITIRNTGTKEVRFTIENGGPYLTTNSSRALIIRTAQINRKIKLEPFTPTIARAIEAKGHFAPQADSTYNLGDSARFWDETFTDELILTNVGAAAAAADKLVLSAIDLSAGNTILDINTEGTGVVGTGTPAADRTIAIRINGTVYYILASTIA